MPEFSDKSVPLCPFEKLHPSLWKEKVAVCLSATPVITATADHQTLVLLTPMDAPSMYTYDPWERLNRFTYRFMKP